MIEIEPLGRGCALPVAVGRRAEVRAFVRALQPPTAPPGASGQVLAQVVVGFQLGDAWQTVAASSPQAIGTEWTAIRFVTEPPPPGATAMVFGIQYAGSTGAPPDLHVDDFSVTER
jgi:hypothetical protein